MTKEEILKDRSQIDDAFFKEEFRFHDAICVSHALEAMESYASQEVAKATEALKKQLGLTNIDQFNAEAEIESIQKENQKLNLIIVTKNGENEELLTQIATLRGLLERAKEYLESFDPQTQTASTHQAQLLSSIDNATKAI